MQKTSAMLTVLVGLVAACGNGKVAGGVAVCCAAADDAGLATCTCQAPGTVSQGGFTSTLTANGSACTTMTTFQGSTSMSAGSVVTSCDNVDAGHLSGAPEAGSNPPTVDASAEAAVTFTPAVIQSKLTFWFDPTSLVATGGKVAKWSDLSGNGNDATQNNPVYQPAYAVSGIHGLASATFTGPITFLDIPDVATMRWGRHDALVIVVARGTALSAPFAMLYQKTGQAPYDGVSLYLNASKPMTTTLAAAQVSGQVYVLSAPPPATFVDGTVHLLGVRRTGTTLEIRVDGAVSSSIANAAVAADVSAIGWDAVIGQNGYGTPPVSEAQQFHGDVAEMIGVNGPLTSTELTNLEQYLKTRYAIP